MSEFDRHALTQTLQQGCDALALPLSEVTIERLIDYLALLSKWNAVYNLTAVRDPQQMVVQHVLDSVSVLPALLDAKRLLDVGAGGGLPGLVLAICAQQLAPEMHIAMIDTVHKKTAFLTAVKSELALTNVAVHTARVEQWQTAQRFDRITSRAFAELADFVRWSAHLLTEDGCFVAMKGVLPSDEIARLPAGWQVGEIRAHKVPLLAAERHLVFIRRQPM